MFDEHQALIEKYALESDEGFARTVQLVLLSIRADWRLVGDRMRDVDENGMQSRFLRNATTLAGWTFARDNANELRRIAIARKSRAISASDCLLAFQAIPGLGLPKAGFLMQLAIGEAGCVDSHNATRFGVRIKAFEIPKQASEALRISKASKYLDLIDKLGGSRKLWNSWCEFIASLRDSTAFDVSELHVQHLGI